MIRRVCIVLALSSLLAMLPAQAAEPPRFLIVAARFMYVPATDVYLSPPTRTARVEMRLPPGVAVALLNTDGDEHDIVSGDPDEHYPYGDGFFESARTRRGEAPVPVAGVENLAPGRYPFFCSVHFGVPSGVLEIVAP
ncbi:MAG TPA: hypothetical protein VM841_12655 [Actinomycetota bacterium]|nr:hypothetical protein [Actinomycetota bacterium]